MNTNERGDATIMLILAGFLTSITLGLIYDLGGTAVQARTEAATAAREAARAAGQELSGQAQESGQAMIDTAAAARAARAYLNAAGIPGEVSVSGTTITVNTTVERPTAFLDLVNVPTVKATSTASANPETAGPQ